MKVLSEYEVNQVTGGWFWWIPLVVRIVGPSLVNMAIYSLAKQHKNEDITGSGLVIAGSAGLLSGGASVGLGAAAGGGLLGPAVWAPTTVTINATGNAIAKQY